MELLDNLLNNLTHYEKEMIQIRRHLHKYPEISFQEKETFKYIMDFYKDLDCEPKPIGKGYGIIVDIKGGKPGKTLGLRADFDALAIYEDNELSFKSVNPGVMHACGHDAHTAYLMILARELIKIKQVLPGRVRIIHQPAEEVSPGGAKGMIEAGALDGVDNTIGVHVMTTLKTGSVAYHTKESQTGRSNFTITVKGSGGHASMPQLSNDAIVAASYFVTELQTIISRRIDPFDTGTVTIGSFDGVGSFNAIKDTVVLKGDVRMMKESTRKIIREQVKQIGKGVEITFGVKVTVDYDDNYPVLYNSEALTHFVVNSLEEQNIAEIDDILDLGPQNPSEDFSYYGQVVPSTFFYIGAQPEDGGNYPHHSPLFKMNEKSILIAAKAVATVSIKYLFENKNM